MITVSSQRGRSIEDISMEWIGGILVAAFLIRLAIFLPQERRGGRRLKQAQHERQIVEAIQPYMVTSEGQNPMNAAHDLPQIVAAQSALLVVEAKARSWAVLPDYHKSNTALLNVISRVQAEWDGALESTHQERQELDSRTRKALEHYLRTIGRNPAYPQNHSDRQQSILHAFLFGYTRR